MRSLLREPSRCVDVATRSEALGIHTSLARDGRLSAAIALESALRNTDPGESDVLQELVGAT